MTLFAMFALLAAAPVQAQQDEAPACDTCDPLGRYQLLRVNDSTVMAIDRETGQCWSKTMGGSWRDEGNPSMALPRGGESPTVQITLRVPPEGLELTVPQRRQRAVPGSNDTIIVRLDRIVDGQVLLTLFTIRGKALIDLTSVMQGDALHFEHDERTYRLEVRELRELSSGGYARIAIAPAPSVH